AESRVFSVGLWRLVPGGWPHDANTRHGTAARAEPGDGHWSGCADLLGEHRQIHAPSGTCCMSTHDTAVGRTLLGLARPVVSNERRSRACASRSMGLNINGMKSRFSRPMPCS